MWWLLAVLLIYPMTGRTACQNSGVGGRRSIEVPTDVPQVSFPSLLELYQYWGGKNLSTVVTKTKRLVDSDVG